MTFFKINDSGKFAALHPNAPLFDTEQASVVSGSISSVAANSGMLHPIPLPKSAKPPIGALIATTSSEFKNYYEAVMKAALAGDRTAAFDPEIASNLLKEAVLNKELGNAVWLLKNGADLSEIHEIATHSAAESEFLKILEIHSKHPKASAGILPKDLDHYALELGYGYKTANLGVISSQLKNIEGKLTFCDLSVPEYQGISHHEIKFFLKEHFPSLDSLWQEFLNTFPPLQKDKFLQAGSDDQVDMLIPESGKLILAEIQQKIAEAFSTSPFAHIALSELVDVSHPEWIIVRSTGREDSKENANAGGNDSIPFISADHESISKAIGNVVASYFGTKSIIQRLQAKDKTLFTSEPFMPVLLQKMVCENNAGGIGSKDIDIPCSGVLFTREQGKDPNVVTINAARGSNEGVVASQVVTDTYQVHPDGVYSTIRVQPTRFVHIPKDGRPGYNVGPVLNADKKVSHGPALSTQMVSDLSVLARELGKVYSENGQEVAPMDMEFTIKKVFDEHAQSYKTVIYPLQIRPLQEMKKSNPSFLDRQELTALDPKGHRQVHGSTLLDGGSEVRTITNPELEVIIADDITEALNKYQHHEEVKEVKAILIRQPAPLTSHECVTLRPKGVPVIVIEDAEEFLRAQTLVLEAAENTPTILCAQRSIIYHANNKEEEQALVKTGLIAYPGPVELSMKNPSVMSLHLSNLNKEELKLFLKNIDSSIEVLTDELSPGHLNFKDAPLSELMDKMAMCSSPEAKEALATYLKKIQALFHDTLAEPNIDACLAFELAECMHRIVNLCKGHVRKAIETKDPQSMERLFPLKQLLALTLQKGNAGLIGATSLMNLISAIKNSAKFNPAELGLPNAPLSKVLMTISREATKEEYQVKWYAFLTAVYKSNGEKGLIELWALLNRLNGLGLRSHWFNVTFQDYPKPTLKKIRADIEQQQAIFETLENYNTKLLGMQQSISNWADPEFFKKRFAFFDKTFSSIGFDGKKPSQLAVLYGQANALGQAAILEFLHRAIDVYDESIKSISGSGQYSSKKEQAKAFAAMLVRYFEMLRTATEIAAPFEEEITKLVGANAKAIQKKHKLDKFETYLTYLKERDFNIHREAGYSGVKKGETFGKALDTITKEIDAMSDEDCAKLLESREIFNVAAVALGSHTDLTFCIYWPKTLEELFTTYHQSMEALVKMMKTKIGMDKSRLPSSILAVCEGIEAQTKQSISKMSVNKGILDVVYHIPFNSHASEIMIRTDLNKPELGYQIHMTVFGNEETNRWKTTGAFAALLAELPGCSFVYGAKPKINYLNPVGMGLSVKYQITPEFAYSAEFGKMFFNLLMSGGITYSSSDGTGAALVKGVAAKGGFTEAFPHLKSANDWLALSEGFFASTLLPNLPLLQAAIGAGDTESQKKIIRGTCLALASYGHPDVNSGNVKNWSGFPNLFQKSGNGSIGSLYALYSGEIPPGVLEKLPLDASYLKALFFSIYHLFKTNPAAAEELVAFLKSHPKTKTHFKGFTELLDSCMKPAHVIVEEKLFAGLYNEALAIAFKSKKPELTDMAASAWKAQVPQGMISKELLSLVKALSLKTMDEALPLLQALGIPSFQVPEINSYFQELAKTASRKQFLDNLQTIGAQVKALGSGGPSIDLIACSTQALIGLSQSTAFISCSPGAFSGLSKYLSVEPYKMLLVNNYHNTTTKLYKAATFYLLDALGSQDPSIRHAAEMAVKTLTADFALYGAEDPSGNHFKECLFAIVAGYRHQNPGNDKASFFLNGDSKLVPEFEAYWQKAMGAKDASVTQPSKAASSSSQSSQTTSHSGASAGSREFYFHELGKLGEEIYQMGILPEAPQTLYQLCSQALIGLSQDPKCQETSIPGKYFQGLGDYLGKPPYHLMLEGNGVNATRKIYKAVTFYLLKGMQSKKPEEAALAKEAFKAVVKDYLTAGHKDVSGALVLRSLFACILGCKMVNPAEDVSDLLLGNPALLALFAKLKGVKVQAMPVAEPLPAAEIGPSEPAASGRQAFFKKLSVLGEEMRALGLIPVSEKLLERCMQCLIGLSQSTDFHLRSAVGNFNGLEKYLGVMPYSKFVVQNVHNTTTKLYKAAIFYILSGIFSPNPGISAMAVDVVKALANDYAANGHKDNSSKQFLQAIFAICRGCEEGGENEEDVALLLNGDPHLLAQYKAWKTSVV